MLGEIIPFIYVIIFLYGLCIGSFLNVCIYRIPLKESVAKSRSHCMSCGNQLKWYDLVPLFSYLFLRGKCRKCKAKISVQYPIVETLNGLGYVFIFWVNDINLTSILYSLCFSALIVLTVIDWRTFEIPFGINIFIFILGVIETIADYHHIVNHLLGFISVSGFLYILVLATKGRAMGGGDVKLMAAAGLLIGVGNIILSLILGCIFGSVIHIARMRVQKKDHRLAFGPYLSAGIFIAMLFGNDLIQWYFSLFHLN